MAPKPNVSLNSPDKPSKLLALVALAVAFALPFVLVKTFHHKKAAPQTIAPSVSIEAVITQPATGIAAADTAASLTTLSAASKAPLKVRRPDAVKHATEATIAAKSEWTKIKTRDKDSMAAVFNRVGLSAQTLQTVIKDTADKKNLFRLKSNQELQFLINRHVLEKLIIPISSTQTMHIYLENGHYKTKVKTLKVENRNQFVTATIQGSLSTTAKKHNIPYKLVQQMTEILTWDIDFAKDIRPGDKFSMIYSTSYVENKQVSTGDIIAVSYTNRGKVYQAVRHTNRAGYSDYYTPEGLGLKKAFTRYPIQFSHISSTFSLSRYHPVLHYKRAHKGVDLAARIGTPIQATGDGRIEIISRQNGYGNMIKIRHNNTYSTVYGHMLKFQKGLGRGDFVKRGQIIGYVGQSGLASGPHCHYEFHINNQPKNPTTINLPRGDPIPKREFARFKANSTTLLAQLKHFNQNQMAKKDAKNNSKIG